MSAVTSYTPDQQRVIDLDEGTYLLTAPPGSGKTQILVERSIRLLSESAAGSFRILALTFTTRAADELRDRVAAGVASEWRRMTTCTFHAFALDVLRHYGERIGVGPQLTVFESEDDRLESLAQALTDEGLPVSRDAEDLQRLRAVLAEISRLKRGLVPPDAAPRTKERGIKIDVAYQAYARKLHQLGAADFDDLLLLANRLFAEHPRVARHYRRMYRYVLIDEAQDTSRAQYELLRSLLGDEHRNVLMVADADQAIFAFAGSDFRYLKEFQRDFEAERLDLTSNFRCARAIVAAAGRLIEHNPGTRRPQMTGAGDAEGHWHLVEAADEEAEATTVTSELQRLLTDGLDSRWLSPDEVTAVRPEQICVLGRSRYALTATRSALETAGVPCQFGSGDAGLFDTQLFRGLHYALRVAGNPRDLLSLENLVALLEPASEKERESWRTRSASELLTELAKPAGVALNVKSLLDPTASGKVFEAALKPLTALAGANGAASDEAERMIRDAESLKERWRAFGRSTPPDERDLGGFLHHLSLAGRASPTDPGVRVLTIHAVKGLEFRVVLLVGMNEGTFPDYRSKDTRAIEDERVNAYVAVTRAGRYLQLSRPRSRLMPWGDVRSQAPSRFLGELGA